MRSAADAAEQQDEIRRGIRRLRSGVRRTRLESWLEVDLGARFRDRILAVDDAVADRWGVLTEAATVRGRPIPVVDGSLAATAMEHNLTLVTRNARDVAGSGVNVLNPWK